MPITKLAVFDFDGTLFKSPEKPDWWPHQGFWGRLETLSPPYVPERPGSDWWAGNIVQEAKRACSDAQTYTVLMTGRIGKFEGRVRDLLDGVGLRFDDYFFAGGGSTLSFKTSTLMRLVERFPSLETVEMWDDRPEHASEFESVLESLGLGVTVHRVPRVTRDFEKVAKVASRFTAICQSLTRSRS